MIDRHPNPRQLEQLFQDLEDGCISAEDHRLLTSLMKSDAAIRRKFLAHMSFASALHAEATAAVNISGKPPWQNLLPTGRKDVLRSVILAAAAVLIFGLVAALVKAPKGRSPSVVAGPGTVWEYVRGGVENGGFADGTLVSVRQGTLEMTSARGTRVMLEGPAEFMWHTHRSTVLKSGQAWVAVAKGDEGFSVQLPRVKVIDLGTEFGVISHSNGDEVHVAVGRVRVQPNFRNLAERELTTGEAVSSDAVGRISEIPCNPQRFLRHLPAGPVYIRWSFEQGGNVPQPATASGITPHPIVSPGDAGSLAVCDGPFGTALDLRESTTGAVSGFAGIGGSNPRTVALWVRGTHLESAYSPRGYVINPTLFNWGLPGGEGHKWNLALNPAGTGLVLQWGGSWESAALPKGETVLDDRWHHIAVVFSGSQPKGRPEIRFYVDGKPLRPGASLCVSPVETRLDSSGSLPLTLGVVDAERRNRQLVSPICIDELVIARQVLSESEIRHLMETNRLELQAE